MTKLKQLILIALLTIGSTNVHSQFIDTISFYPNPFKDSTAIHIQIAQDSKVSLFIYNLLGLEVGPKFKDTFLHEGSYTIAPVGVKFPNGIYIVKFVGSAKTMTKKILKDDQISGIKNKPISKNEITIFPNPTNGDINIRFNNIQDKGIKLNICDQTGKQVYTNVYFANKDIKIDLSNFDNGIYTINMPELNYNCKLIVVK